MKSRTVRTCENILKGLIKEYSPFARVGKPLIEKAIIVEAGGDPRTVNRYFEQLKLLEFIRGESRGLYSLNWKKVDYAQMSIQEVLVSEEDEPP
jgi:hypothetical protein